MNFFLFFFIVLFYVRETTNNNENKVNKGKKTKNDSVELNLEKNCCQI